MLLGVAAGLGRYFDVDPVIVRIGFAVSIFIGGLGAFAYAALALFVPTADDAGNVVERPPIERSRGLAIAAGVGILVVALSWGVFDGGFLWDGGWFFGPPLLLIALAVGLFLVLRDRGADAGGAARSTGRTVGQIVLAIVLAFVALGVLVDDRAGERMGRRHRPRPGRRGRDRGDRRDAGGVRVPRRSPLAAVARGRAGDPAGRWYPPPTSASARASASASTGRPRAAAIPGDGYELGIGRLVVDLRDLEWADDTVVDLDVDLGIGQAIVAVPEDVCVAGTLSARAGHLDLAGDECRRHRPRARGLRRGEPAATRPHRPGRYRRDPGGQRRRHRPRRRGAFRFRNGFEARRGAPGGDGGGVRAGARRTSGRRTRGAAASADEARPRRPRLPDRRRRRARPGGPAGG